ncbi:MAG: peptidase M48 Ste24p, partial [Deltaproteobacteria bacterium]
SALFATHPPLHLRIKAIDPAFDPAELDAIAKAWANPLPVGDSDNAQVSISGFAPAAIAAAVGASAPAARAQAVLPQADAEISLTPREVVTQVAHPGSDDYRTANAIHDTISEKLRALAYMGTRCQQVVFALAIDTDVAMRGTQLGLLEKRFDANVRKGVEEILAETDTLHPMQRLPLAQLAFPALRRQPRPQLQTFLIALNELIQADGEVRLEEYCLAKLVTVQVMDALDPSKARPTGSTKLVNCASEVADALAIVAAYGADNEADAERAYLVGMNEVLPDNIAPYMQRAEWTVALDCALPILDALTPAGKELLVRGLTAAIGADGKVSVTEAELLRTICAALHCPLPPQLDQAA